MTTRPDTLTLPTTAVPLQTEPVFLIILVKLTIYLFLGFITIIGNAIVVLSFIIDKDIRSSPANAFICNLAIADFFVGIVHFLAEAIWILLGSNLQTPYLLCFCWGYLRNLTTLMSSVLLVMITWDRFKLVSDALKYKRDRTSRKNLIQTLVAWTVVAVYVFMTIFIFNKFYFDENLDVSSTMACIPSTFPKLFFVLTILPDFVFPFLLILTFNVMILLTLRKITLLKVETYFSHHNALREGRQSCNKRRTKFLKNVGVDLKKSSPLSASVKPNVTNVVSKDVKWEDDRTLNHNDASTNLERGHISFHVRNRESEADEETTYSHVYTDQCANSSEKEGSATSNTEKCFKKDKRSYNPPEIKRELHKLHKAVKSLALFTFVYFICWIPFYVIFFLSYFGVDIEDKVIALGGLILASNSAINPFLYALMSYKFRRRFKLLLCFNVS